MTDYFVRNDGSDGNAGTSSGTGGAWQTIGKALGSSGISAADTVFIAPGVYRETVTIGVSNPTPLETFVKGDPDASEFSDLDGGDIIWTAYTTDDKTVPTTSRPLVTNGRNFFTVEDVILVGGNANPSTVGSIATNQTQWTFRRVLFLPGRSGQNVNITTVNGSASDHLFDRCIFFPGANASCVAITLPTNASADYDSNIRFENCLFYISSAGTGVSMTASGANSFKGGGVDIFNCTFFTGTNGVSTTSANVASVAPNQNFVYNSIFLSCGTGLNANTSGQIVEDYNLVLCNSAASNVTQGSNSIWNGASGVMTYAPLFNLGQDDFTGRTPRPHMAPSLRSPALGFGNQAGGPTVDIFDRIRPSGPAVTWANSLNAAGCLEYSNTGQQETTTVRTGASSMKLLGPAQQSFDLPVDPVATTVTVYGRFDSSYGAGTKPRMTVRSAGEVGVTDATATMTAAADTWEQLSLTFTPTRRGVVKIRLRSDAAGTGAAFFDDFNVV